MNSYRVYKANKQGNGSASEWQLSYKKQEQYTPWKLFFSIAAQTGIDQNGNARFNWDNAIRVKMDLSDIGEILTVLEGKQTQAGPGGKLYHQNGNGNKIINFTRNEGTNNYFIKVSHQNQQGVVALQQTLSLGEGCTLKVLLEQAIIRLAHWGMSGRRRTTNNQGTPGYQSQNNQSIPTNPQVAAPMNNTAQPLPPTPVSQAG